MTRIRLALAALLAGLIPLSHSDAAAPYAGPSFLDGPYQPPLILLQTPRRGVLQNAPSQYGSVRSYTNDRGGNTYDVHSPLPFGAPLDAANELVIVRPREAVPAIAISPWEPITDRTIDELERNYPWIRRTESIRQDLVIARNQYLRERGYVGTVRSFTNRAPQTGSMDVRPMRVFSPGEAPPTQGSDPHMVIIESGNEAQRDRIVEERLKPGSVIRSSHSEASED
jgi:hypothetical protein